MGGAIVVIGSMVLTLVAMLILIFGLFFVGIIQEYKQKIKQLESEKQSSLK